MRQQAANERARHVAAADECNDFVWHGFDAECMRARLQARGPNSAVPTRTWVAPSLMASSKSPLMPIDSVSSA